MSRTIYASVTPCGGQLFAWYVERVGIGAYDVNAGQADDKGMSVTYERGGVETPVVTIDSLFALIRTHGCTPKEEAAKAPAEFAVILGFLANVRGRVIDMIELWDFLDDAYGVRSADLMPRIEGGSLWFTDAVINLFRNETYIVKIGVDLDSGAVTTHQIDLVRKKA
jgi:hypothetical protein